MPRLFSLLLVIVLAGLVPVAGSAQMEVVEFGGSDQVLDLARPWSFRAGDDLAWALPNYDDGEWDEILVPLPWGRQGYGGYLGIGWYRLRIDLAEEMGPQWFQYRDRLAVAVGKVSRAYEIYAGGRQLGGVGSLPPSPAIDYDRYRIYPLPAGAINRRGEVVLALRVWAGPAKPELGGGPFSGPFLVGPAGQVVQRVLLGQLPQLILAVLFAVVGLYHLYLYRRGYEERIYLWFGLTSFNVALYSFLRTQWKYELTANFLLLKEVEYLLVYCWPALLVQFFWSLLGRPIGRLLRAYQVFCVGLGVLVALTPGLGLNQLTLDFWQLLAVVVSGVALWVLAEGLRQGKPEARTIALGAVLLIAAYVHDIAVDRGWISSFGLLPVGFSAFVFSMAASLAHRFGRIHREAQDLRTDLEVRVWERTAELARSNAQLQLEVEERARAEGSLRKHLAAMEVSTDGIVILDAQYRYLYANAAYGNMFGYEKPEHLLDLVWWVVHEEEEAEKLSVEALPLLEGEGYWQGEAVGRRLDGSRFPTEVSAAAIEGEGFVCVYRDVTERHKVDRLKDEFVATVSHELRTPLTSIKGSLALVTEGVMGDLPEPVERLLQVARTNSDRLVRLINDLLDIQKIEAGKVDFELRRMALREVMEQAVAAYQPMAQQQGVKIHLRECPPDLRVRADTDRFQQVLGNLLSNAVKFSPAGAVVSLAAEPNHRGILIRVEDQGPGIPEEFRSRVFERFAQARGSEGPPTGGTGLGLSIARAIVRQQGGDITFECGDAGGTTFLVEMPSAD